MLFIPIIPSQAAAMASEPHCVFDRLNRLANADQINTPIAAPITVLSKPGVTHSGRLSPPSCAQSQNDQVPQCGIANTLTAAKLAAHTRCVLVKSAATPTPRCNLLFCCPSAPNAEYLAHTVGLEGVGV